MRRPTAAEAVVLARTDVIHGQPHALLNDIRAARKIAATAGLHQVRVLNLTGYDTDTYVHEVLEAETSGFLLRDRGPGEVLHGIRVVAGGATLLEQSPHQARP
ncbi:hypothetical protein OG417_34060 [Actinoallomurus sp. NBC_01490]|jgi:DNA-binding NarL/FixJ family response regulator|uniref:hypothetical protein n=1 Tax=Actinoallomurus sp. NBC_01490 TaxID=2903557 RepID=UPI002E35C3B2|nr:hypothetical protein [Actinoallomurus sp. NBC_01490]